MLRDAHDLLPALLDERARLRRAAKECARLGRPDVAELVSAGNVEGAIALLRQQERAA